MGDLDAWKDGDGGLGLNDLGVPALAHFENYPPFHCPENQNGDWMVEDVVEVTCPWCLKKIEELKERRRKLLGK